VRQLLAVAKTDLELLVAPGLRFGGQGQRLVGSVILGGLIEGFGGYELARLVRIPPRYNLGRA
jgi:hypothetical protein